MRDAHCKSCGQPPRKRPVSTSGEPLADVPTVECVIDWVDDLKATIAVSQMSHGTKDVDILRGPWTTACSKKQGL
jgi:hypothetical protein